MNTMNILISGTSFWNPGDDFVRDGVIQILKRLFPDKKLNFLFYNFNEDFLPYNKFRGVHNMVAPGDVSKFAQYIDLIVIAGLPVGREIKDLYNDILKNNLQKKVILVGAGYENFYIDRHIAEYPEIEIFKNAKVITGRTAKKPPLFEQYNLNYNHINCPALLSVPEIKKISLDKKIEHIGFSIQIPHEMGIVNQATSKEMFELAMKIMQSLYGEYKISLVAHHKSEYFPFLSLIRKRNLDIELLFSSFYQDYHDIYKEFDLVISTRLHACLFGLGHGIPGIVINDTGRHKHCLDGFIYVPWVRDEAGFRIEFDKMLHLNLYEVTKDVSVFKENLFTKYTSVLAPALGLRVMDTKQKNKSAQDTTDYSTAVTQTLKMPLHELIERANLSRILYVRTDSIGDAVISLGMLEHLKNKNKEPEITVICQEHIKELYDACEYVDSILTFDKRNFQENSSYRIDFLQQLTSTKYDIVLNPIYSRDKISDLIALSANADFKVAFEGDNSNLDVNIRLENNKEYSYLIPSSDDVISEIRRNEIYLKALGIENACLEPWIWLKDNDIEFANNLFNHHKITKSNTVGLFVKGQYSIRDYPYFPEVLRALSIKFRFTFICLGSAEDYETHENICKTAGVKYINLCGQLSIRQSATMLMQCKAALGVETALAHIATAVGTPNFVILGGGHFGRFFPYDKLQSGIINPLDCFNCNWQCKYKSAYCLTDISPEVVIAAFEKSMSKSEVARIFYVDDELSLLKNIQEIEALATKNDFQVIKIESNFEYIEIPESKLPLISVITPTYNQAKYIEKTILSVLAQDYSNFEHVIVDGGSTDGTIEILKNYPHLNWISEKDGGQTEALNKGLRMAKGDIIAWINSDDYYFDGVFSEIATYFIENPTEKVVHGNAKMGIESTKHTIDLKHYTYDFEEILQYWYGATMPTQPAVFFKRELIAKYGYFDETLKYAMDFEYWCRISRFHRFNHINKFFSYYLLHNQSKSGEANDWTQFYPEWHQVYMRYRKYSKKIPNNTLLTIFIPFSSHNTTIDEVEKLSNFLLFAGNQRMRDAEIIVYTDIEHHYLDDTINRISIPCIILDGFDFSNKGLLSAIESHASGSLVHYPDYNIEYIPDWYCLAIHKFLEIYDRTNVLTDSNVISSVKDFLKEIDLIGPDKLVKKDFLLSNTLHIEQQITDNEKETGLIFSVIIPTYNRAEILKKSLEALNKQNFDHNDFEVIVSDDGSTDNTEELVKSFKSEYKLKYIKNKNSGPAAARNKAIIEAKGKYILIINDDTIASTDLIANHLKIQQKFGNRKIAALGTFDYVSESLAKPFTNYLSQSTMVFPFPGLHDGQFYNYRYFITCNLSITRSALIEVGLFDEDFREPMFEDTELGYRLEKIGYSVLFSKSLNAKHDHSMNINEFCKRQFMSGRNLVTMAEKHPEFLEVEHKLFGFSDIETNTLNLMRHFIKQNENEVNQAIAKINDLEKITVVGSKAFFNNVELDITADQIHKFINQYIFKIHLYHFYKGIIEAKEKNQKAHAQVRSLIEPKKNRKVLFTMFGWNESGGGTMFPKTIAIELVNRGYDVTVVFAGLRHPKNETPYYVEHTVDKGVNLIGIYNRKYDFIIQNDPEIEIKDERIVKIFREILNTVSPDVIHYHNFLGLSFNIAEVAGTNKCRKFFTPHNYHLLDPQLYMFNHDGTPWNGIDFVSNSELSRQFPHLIDSFTERNRKAIEIINNHTDKVLAISTRVQEILNKAGIAKHKLQVVHQIPLMYNGKHRIDEKTTSLPIKIAYFGSLIPHKGVHVLVEAVQKVNSDKISVRIFGSGPVNYIEYLKSLDKNRICEFKGEYSRENLGTIASGLDLVVVPSIWEEGAGLVILESHYYGLPVICSSIGGIPDFIKSNENGIMFEPGNAHELADILSDLIKFPSKIDFMKKQTMLNKSFFDYVAYLEKIYFSDEHIASDFRL